MKMTHAFEPKALRKYYWSLVLPYLIGIGLACALMGGLALLENRRIHALVDDKAGAIERIGVGKAVGLQATIIPRRAPGILPVYLIHFRAQDYGVSTTERIIPGESVKVHYRVGKSGDIYIEQVEPLSN